MAGLVPAELHVGAPVAVVAGPPWAGYGQPAPVELAFPDNANLVGAELYAQGFLVDLISAFPSVAATRAYRLRVGP